MPQRTQHPWIKWCKGLVHRREVLAIADRIVTLSSRNERDDNVRTCAHCVTHATVAAWCMMVWEWADDNTADGRVDGVSPMWIDQIVGCEGFADAMISVGWLAQTPTGIEFPNWKSHNGASAKKRAQDQKRSQSSRDRHAFVTQTSRSERDESVTREEKRREEKSKEEERETTSLLSADADPSTNGHMGPTGPELQEAWNRIVTQGLRCTKLAGKRAVALKTRNRDPYFREHWLAAMHRITESPFCCGDNQRGWVADIDWFLRPDTVLKLIEGKYDGREPAISRKLDYETLFGENAK